MHILRVLSLCILLTGFAMPASARCETGASAEACAVPEACPAFGCDECRPAALSPGKLVADAPLGLATQLPRSAIFKAPAVRSSSGRTRPLDDIPLYLRLARLRN